VGKLQFVFVHGLSGWGSYDEQYRRMPYWGMRGGDLTAYLRGKGFDCYAASVAPTGSAWDRACELYAQIAGTRTDYGAAHSQRYRHERYGPDFSTCPLIPEWNGDTRLVLIGHSFGGATVRLFSHLLAYGDEEERRAGSEDLSPLFEGGFAERVLAVAALAAPMNGTTAYDLFADPSFEPAGVKTPWWSGILARMLSKRVRTRKDDRDERDFADFDMRIDNALAMNRRIGTLPGTYYFSVPCGFTEPQPDGTHRPIRGMEPLFVMRSCQIGAYAGTTGGGFRIDESWRENDGLVNTVSAKAPSGAPAKPLDRMRVQPGVWNVFPTYKGDHMALQGGLTHRHEIRGFYEDLLSLIESLPSAGPFPKYHHKQERTI
jgi:triacylglycerol lipase